MASREGQGMQIAVILFAILTVILAITTYIFYAQAEKNDKARIAAVEGEKNAKAAQLKANYQLTALKYVLGINNTPLTEVDAAKGMAGNAEDPDVTKWLAGFNNDMLLFGDAAPDTVKNYTTLPTYLLNSISRKNQSVVTIGGQLLNEQVQKKAAVESEQARAQVAEDGLKTATDDYTSARATNSESLQNTIKTANETQAKADAANKAAAKTIADKVAENNSLAAALTRARDTSEQMAAQRNELLAVQGVNIDNPDATIVWINQKQRLVWIDRGYDDGLGRQMSFAVYSQNQATLFRNVERMRKEGTGMEKVKKLESKGRIEVVRVVGPHQAECRILEDKAADPILPGDWVHSPAWSPGQRLHFALFGFMDIDGDLESDRETIKHIITMNGGIIDTEIKDDGERDTGKMSVNTRYVVMGDTTESGNAKIKNLTQYQKTRTDFITEMEQYSVEKISVQQLLDMMGWKPEEKTTGLGGGLDTGRIFRRPTDGAKPYGTKTPGAAPPGATTPSVPAEEPAEAAPKAPAKEPAAGETADPFGEK